MEHASIMLILMNLILSFLRAVLVQIRKILMDPSGKLFVSVSLTVK